MLVLEFRLLPESVDDEEALVLPFTPPLFNAEDILQGSEAVLQVTLVPDPPNRLVWFGLVWFVLFKSQAGPFKNSKWST